MTLPDELPGHSKVVWHAEAVATHPEHIELDENGHPVIGEDGEPVVKADFR